MTHLPGLAGLRHRCTVAGQFALGRGHIMQFALSFRLNGLLSNICKGLQYSDPVADAVWDTNFQTSISPTFSFECSKLICVQQILSKQFRIAPTRIELGLVVNNCAAEMVLCVTDASTLDANWSTPPLLWCIPWSCLAYFPPSALYCQPCNA